MTKKKMFVRMRAAGVARVATGLAVSLSSVALIACGSSSGPSNEEVAQIKKHAAEHVHKEVRLRRLERELRHVKQGGGTVPARNESARPAIPSTSARESCGGNLEVNSYTTCGFAQDVEQAYFGEISSGSGTVEAYSPTTSQTYSMYCTAGEPHECTGGNNAAVYFP